MDMTWLAAEAKTLHGVFQEMFFSFLMMLFVIGIILELFKIPLGGTPEVAQLASRLLIATIIMVAVPDVMNILADIADNLTKQLGAFNDFQHVKERLKEQLSNFSMSWVSVKDAILLVISLLSYVVLLVGLYFSDAIFVYSWMLIYIFSPILSACFVLPSTAGATRMLFKSMIEVTVWKCLWAVMGALVWSMAASQINDPKYEINFVTVIILNLLLFASLWKVPSLTSAFLQSGVSQVASGLSTTLMDKTSGAAKNLIQLYGGNKLLKLATMASQKPSGDGKGPPSLGSHKYRSMQKKGN